MCNVLKYSLKNIFILIKNIYIKNVVNIKIYYQFEFVLNVNYQLHPESEGLNV